MSKLVDDIIFAIGISAVIILLFIFFIISNVEDIKHKKYYGMTDEFILYVNELSFKTSIMLISATYCCSLFLTHKFRKPCKEN